MRQETKQIKQKEKIFVVCSFISLCSFLSRLTLLGTDFSVAEKICETGFASLSSLDAGLQPFVSFLFRFLWFFFSFSLFFLFSPFFFFSFLSFYLLFYFLFLIFSFGFFSLFVLSFLFCYCRSSMVPSISSFFCVACLFLYLTF